MDKLLNKCQHCPLLRFHPGEVEHIADGMGIGQEHDQPVDADANAACWRHALADRFDELFVEGTGLLVAGLAPLGLIFQQLALDVRVI